LAFSLAESKIDLGERNKVKIFFSFAQILTAQRTVVNAPATKVGVCGVTAV